MPLNGLIRGMQLGIQMGLITLGVSSPVQTDGDAQNSPLRVKYDIIG